MSFWTVEIDVGELERDWADACRALSDGCRRGVARGIAEAAAQARASHPYRDQSGRLTGSIGGRVVTSTGGGAEGVIEATARHASFVEGGTPPHEIRAGRADVLRWESGGSVRFARVVHHPGTSPRPFMEPAVLKVERVIEREVGVAEAEAARIMER
jgi:hypothetical protein